MRSKILLITIGSVLLLSGPVGAGDTEGQTQAQKAKWAMKIDSMLKNAATAEESWRTANPSYTDRVSDLRREGFREPGDRYHIRIPLATESKYCINGRREGWKRRFHYHSDDGTPSAGKCP